MDSREIRTKEALVDALKGHDLSHPFTLTGAYHMISLPGKITASGTVTGAATVKQVMQSDNRGSYTIINGEKMRIYHQLITTYQLDQYNNVGKVLAMLTRVDKVNRILSE